MSLFEVGWKGGTGIGEIVTNEEHASFNYSLSNNTVTISLRSISALRANSSFLGALLFVPRRIFDSSETKKKRYDIKFYCASCIHHGWL